MHPSGPIALLQAYLLVATCIFGCLVSLVVLSLVLIQNIVNSENPTEFPVPRPVQQHGNFSRRVFFQRNPFYSPAGLFSLFNSDRGYAFHLLQVKR